MRFCYTSYQEREHAHEMGIEQARECAIELLMMENLRMAHRYLKALGKRHCRHGFKPAIEQKEYLNGYSNQYVKENAF